MNRGIKTITIDKFKSIDHLVLDVSEHGADSSQAGNLMLLADNAAGKTSVLQAIALAVIGPEQAIRLDIDRNLLVRKDRRTWGQSEKEPAHVRVDFHSGETSEIVLNPFTLEFSGHSRAVDGLMAYGAHRLLGRRKARAKAPSKRIASLFDSLAEVPHPEDWLADHRTPFEIVARALSEVLVLNEGDGITRDVSGNVSIQTYGQQTPIDVLSDGYRSVIAMSVDMIHWLLRDWPDLETARGVVLIDEIDAHLHPRWKLQIVGALRAAMPGVQFITTTHDPLCLRGMGKGEVVVMKRSTTQRFDLITSLPDFRTMSAEQILMSDYFGLNTTSDPSADILIGTTADRFATRPDGALTVAVDEALDGLMIGEGPERQVADAALLRYLRERKSASGEAVSNIRREAIEAALKAIRAGDAKK
ncbi:hypothetical protein IE00_09670 [Paracoccus sp. SM22M-07]|nr:hypothetical protein IE00_09670 [Paracoccus sp. SM22M-07]